MALKLRAAYRWSEGAELKQHAQAIGDAPVFDDTAVDDSKHVENIDADPSSESLAGPGTGRRSCPRRRTFRVHTVSPSTTSASMVSLKSEECASQRRHDGFLTPTEPAAWLGP